MHQQHKVGAGRDAVALLHGVFSHRAGLEGGHMLASIWLAAYRGAGPDNFLRSALIKRQTAAMAHALHVGGGVISGDDDDDGTNDAASWSVTTTPSAARSAIS